MQEKKHFNFNQENLQNIKQMKTSRHAVSFKCKPEIIMQIDKYCKEKGKYKQDVIEEALTNFILKEE